MRCLDILEEENMGLRFVNFVMLPSQTLKSMC